METINIKNKTKRGGKTRKTLKKKKRRKISLKKLFAVREEKHLQLAFLIGLRNATKAAFKSLVFPDN